MNLAGTALRMQQLTSPTGISTTIAIPPPAEFALGLTEMLTTALVATDRFVVLERSAIEQIKAEQDLGTTGRTSAETAAAAGRITGAQLHITGDITEFSYQQSNLGGNVKLLKGIKAKGERVTAMVGIDIRLVDAVTSEVVWSRGFRGTASMTGVGAEFAKLDREIGGSASVNTPLGKASREAIEKAVAAIVAQARQVPWSGRIVDVRDGQVYINAGSALGLKPGMLFEVFDQQPALIDPETGRTLGAPDRKIGALAVETVEESYSIARITEGSGFKRNHIVRIRGQRERP